MPAIIRQRLVAQVTGVGRDPGIHRMTTASTSIHRVAIAGVFDIANYGDQLFPLIAAYRLKAHGIDVEAVAPVAQHRLRPDAMRPHDLTWLMTTDEAVDAVLIGGGNILYNLRADYAPKSRIAKSIFGLGQHTGLWLGASIAAALRDIPFGFNAPGVPYPFSGAVVQDVLKPVLAAADIVAVRDVGSARLAGAAGVDVSVVPDTAVDIAGMWPRPTLDPVLRALAERLGWNRAPYAAIHLRAGPGEDAHVVEVARRLDGFCAEHGLEAVLITIGDDLGDGRTACSLQAAMTTRTVVLDGSSTLREVAATIANARLYLGGSLHGYVTATAYGVPGILAPTSPQRKFGGFLEWMERRQDLAGTWQEACERGAELLHAGSPPQVPPRARASLDSHWSAVVDMVRSPARRAPERAEMLRRMTARAGGRLGMKWLLAPCTTTLRDRRAA